MAVVNIEGNTTHIRAELAALRAEISQLMHLVGQMPGGGGGAPAPAGGPKPGGDPSGGGTHHPTEGGGWWGLSMRRSATVARYAAHTFDIVRRAGKPYWSDEVNEGLENISNILNPAMGTIAWGMSMAAFVIMSGGLGAIGVGGWFMLGMGALIQGSAWNDAFKQFGLSDVRKGKRLFDEEMRQG